MVASINFDVFWRDHGARRGAGELGGALDESAQRADKMKDAVKVGALAAGVAIAAMGKQSIDVANDIAESTSKISVVFGQSSKSVMDFADTSAESLGISKRSALEAAGTFGNLLVSLKLPQAEAAKMSTKMITLAADMASFNNASPEEALDAIRSGLMGETEPLQRFGVNMNDATLRTQALKMGLVKSVKEGLNPAVKAQAAYGLMLAQTGTAQGDFARTSGGLANQTRIAKARFEDLEGELGAALLPTVNKLMQGLTGLLGVLAENQKVIVPLVLGVTGLGAAIWTINKAAAAAAAAHAAWTVVMGANTAAAGLNTVALIRMVSVAKSAVATFGVLGVAVGAVWADEKLRQWSTASVSLNALSEGMKDVAGSGKLSAAELELFANKAKFFGDGVGTSAEALKKFGFQAHDALDQGWGARIARIDDMGKGQKNFEERTRSLDGALSSMVRDGNVDKAAAQMKLYEDAAVKAGVPLASLRHMFPQYASAVKASIPPVMEAEAAVIKHNTAVKKNVEALAADAAALLKTRGSENSYEAAVDDATKAIKDNGKTLDKHTEKGRANRTALDQIASSTLAWRDAAKEAGASQKRQTQITEQGRAELVKMGQRFGLSKKAAREYAREVLGIPKRVSSVISLSLKNGIPKTLYGVRVGGGSGSTRGGITFGMATGGPVRGGYGGHDDIPAMLTRDEHVWTKQEVAAAGGHGAMKVMRRGVLGLAEGGPVFAAQLGRGEAQIAAGTSSRIADRLLKIAQGAIGFNPSLNGALNFARAQVGKPYIWGGVGPRGYDCSGAMSALLNVVQGRNPYSRRFATGNFPAAGFIPGPGSFMIGSRRGNPGHMAGTINGVNVESSGSVGFHMGKSARGARNSMFTGLYHLRGYAKGGAVEGDAPFDLLDRGGDDYLGDAIRRVFLADRGGILRTGRAAVNLSGQDERVLTGAQTRQFDRLVRVHERGGPGPAATNTAVDYDRLGVSVAKAIAQSGLAVKMDGQVVGRIQGRQADLLGRGN
jgi:hypothetical protein